MDMNPSRLYTEKIFYTINNNNSYYKEKNYV